MTNLLQLSESGVRFPIIYRVYSILEFKESGTFKLPGHLPCKNQHPLTADTPHVMKQ